MSAHYRSSAHARDERRGLIVGALVLALSVTLLAWAIRRGGAS